LSPCRAQQGGLFDKGLSNQASKRTCREIHGRGRVVVDLKEKVGKAQACESFLGSGDAHSAP